MNDIAAIPISLTWSLNTTNVGLKTTNLNSNSDQIYPKRHVHKSFHQESFFLPVSFT